MRASNKAAWVALQLPRGLMGLKFVPGSCLDWRMTNAADVARGVSRLLMQEGFSPILEFSLANGRRLDVAALGPDGTVVGVEIKVAIGDLKADGKWPDYLAFCD